MSNFGFRTKSLDGGTHGLVPNEEKKADMASDSWLSKNIRPMTLIAILLGYFVFAILSAFSIDTNSKYVELLGQWGMLIMSFYFGGRTLEKIMDMKSK